MPWLHRSWRRIRRFRSAICTTDRLPQSPCAPARSRGRTAPARAACRISCALPMPVRHCRVSRRSGRFPRWHGNRGGCRRGSGTSRVWRPPGPFRARLWSPPRRRPHRARRIRRRRSPNFAARPRSTLSSSPAPRPWHCRPFAAWPFPPAAPADRPRLRRRFEGTEGSRPLPAEPAAELARRLRQRWKKERLAMRATG